MSRDIEADMLAAIQAGTLSPRLFYEGQFRNTGTMAIEYMRLWSGQGSISWDGKTWSGVGNLIGVDGIEETVESRSVGFKVQINGIASSNLSVALTADQSKYLPGSIWFAAVDATGAVVADPILARTGKLNVVAFDDTGETCTIAAEYEDENVALLIPFNRRWTPEDQAIDYAGDTGFAQVVSLQDAVIEF